MRKSAKSRGKGPSAFPSPEINPHLCSMNYPNMLWSKILRKPSFVARCERRVSQMFGCAVRAVCLCCAVVSLMTFQPERTLFAANDSACLVVLHTRTHTLDRASFFSTSYPSLTFLHDSAIATRSLLIWRYIATSHRRRTNHCLWQDHLPNNSYSPHLMQP